MEIQLRAPGLKLPRGHVPDLVARVRHALARLAHRIARVEVSLAPASASNKPGLRDCLVEVHTVDGHVEVVRERQRRLGAALQVALERVRYRIGQWVAMQLGKRKILRLPKRDHPPRADSAGKVAT